MKDSLLKRKLVAVYELFYEWRRIGLLHTKYRLHIMTYEKTLRYIKKNQCNIARFGDGELGYFDGLQDTGFQPVSQELTEALLQVLSNDNENLLICIPRYFVSLRGCNKRAKTYWIEWGKKDNRQIRTVEFIRQHCPPRYRFGDAHITRPYIDQKSKRRAKKTYASFKKLWKSKDVLIVEGEQTRLGVGNDLLKEARSVNRILAPAKGAFACYAQIKKSVVDHYNGQLVLLALGPTATVLAADLSALNIWALDIGHIDIEYEWYLSNAENKTAIPGKFVQEVKDGVLVEQCEDQEYLSQIIVRITH